MKAARILVPLVVLVAIALWVSHVARSDRHDAPRVTVTSTSPATPSPGTESDPPEPAAEIVVEDDRSSDEPDPSHKTIGGTLIVLDSMGNEHTRENGHFGFSVHREDGMEAGTIKLTEGRWNTWATHGTELRVSHPMIGGRCARFLNGSVPVPHDGSIELYAEWPDPVALHVRSRETGHDIARVVAVRTSRREDHPGVFDASGIFAEGRSPLSITDHDSPYYGTETLCVGATGYAWRRIVIDLLDGGERSILLERGGDLEVRLSGAAPPDGAVLRVSRGEGDEETASATTRLSKLESVQLAGLHPGSYRIAVELGDRRALLEPPGEIRGDAPQGESVRETAAAPPILGAATAEIRAGEQTRVEIEMCDAPAVGLVPLGGELFIPAEWIPLGLEHSHLWIEPLEPVEDEESSIRNIWIGDMPYEERETGRMYQWGGTLVRPGKYVIAVDNTYNVVIDVGAEGEHVRMDLPPPANVSISAVEKGTAEPAAELWVICWGYGHWNGHSAFDNRHNPEHPSETTGTFDFFAPVGEIEIFPVSREFAPTRMKVNVSPGGTRAVLELTRSSGVQFVLTDGNARVPFLWPWRARFHTPSGQEVRTQRSIAPYTILTPEPGQYRVTLTGPDDYEPVPEQIIDVPAATTVEHEIRLERRW